MSIFELQWAVAVKGVYNGDIFWKIHVYANRQLVPRDQVFPFVVVYCLSLLPKNK